MWAVGDRALCIDDRWPPAAYSGSSSVQKAGHIYLVRDVCTSILGRLGLRFAGIECIQHPSGIEYGWYAERFRKIVPACDRKTISSTDSVPSPPSNPSQPMG